MGLYCTCVSSYQLLMTKPVYIVLPLALYLPQIGFVVQRILFLQKFCSLDNFLCTFNFFQIRSDCSLQIFCSLLEEKLKYTVLWGIVALLTNLIFNFPAEDFLMHRS